jgi:hypothetical protein
MQVIHRHSEITVLETTIKFYGIFVRDDSTNLTIKINFEKI